jgi:hypothetical protein
VHRDPLADLAPGHAGSERRDLARGIASQHVREGRLARVDPFAHGDVERHVHRHRADLDEDFARTGRRRGDVLELQDFGAAELT